MNINVCKTCGEIYGKKVPHRNEQWWYAGCQVCGNGIDLDTNVPFVTNILTYGGFDEGAILFSLAEKGIDKTLKERLKAALVEARWPEDAMYTEDADGKITLVDCAGYEGAGQSGFDAMIPDEEREGDGYDQVLLEKGYRPDMVFEDATPTAPRDAILQEAIHLTMGDRNKAYGPPYQNMKHIANLWSVYLSDRYGVDLALSAEDTANMNQLQKIARTHQKEVSRDTYVDAAAYAGIAGECREVVEAMRNVGESAVDKDGKLV